MPIVRAEDGCNLHVEAEGQGPPLLLIAGLSGLSDFWNGLRPLLEHSFRVISFDQRGTGRSERPEQSYTIERMARDGIAILDALDVRTAHVLGHSTGGAIAQTLAVTSPERVERLVLSATWARPDYHFLSLFEMRLAVLRLAGPRPYQRLSHCLAYPPQWMNDHKDELERAVYESERALSPVQVTSERIRMLMRYDGVNDLPRIISPTLVLGAVDDIVVPFHHAELLATTIPGASLVPMSGGHFFPKTSSGAFLDAVQPFLKGPN